MVLNPSASAARPESEAIRPLRILHVLDHSLPLHSGYSFRTRAIIERQRALGWETIHLTGPKQEGARSAEENAEDLHFYRTAPARGVTARIPLLQYFALMRALERRLLEVARSAQPDLLHAHSPALNGVPALAVGRRLGIPVVYEVRAFWEDAAVDHGTSREWGLRYRLTRALETYVLKRAQAVTTICEGLRADILGRGIAPEKVTVIPNAVDLEQFGRAAARDPELARRLGLAGARVLGFIGSFYAYEGLKLLLEAMPAVLAAAPDVRVLLVGGGPDEERLRARVLTLGLADKVIFTGRVPHQAVPGYYDLIDVLVYPRLSMRLTELVTPLKPLEAMAQGRLVLASNVGGHRELIKAGETGELFRAGDAGDLARALLALLAAPERWTGLKERARRFVESERNWTRSVSHYPEVYARALAKLRGALG